MRLGIKCSRIARTAAEPCEKTTEMAKLGSDRLVQAFNLRWWIQDSR